MLVRLFQPVFISAMITFIYFIVLNLEWWMVHWTFLFLYYKTLGPATFLVGDSIFELCYEGWKLIISRFTLVYLYHIGKFKTSCQSFQVDIREIQLLTGLYHILSESRPLVIFVTVTQGYNLSYSQYLSWPHCMGEVEYQLHHLLQPCFTW